MRVTHGPFNVDCLTTKEPPAILQALTLRILPDINSTYRMIGEFKLLCEWQSLKFSIEVTHYEYTEFLYVLRFDRIGGDASEFNKLYRSILTSLNL
jgi:hypothetical protein